MSNIEEQKSALQALPPLELKIGELPFSITPDLFLRAANCRIIACRGCVQAIDYGADNAPSSVIIRWQENCGDTPKGKGTSFDLNPGSARIVERAQDYCLEVIVFFRVCEGEEPKIIKLVTLPKNKACCPDDAPCHKKEEQNGHRRRFF